MKIDTTLGAAMQTSIANNEHIQSQKTESSTTPAYQVELTGTVHDTTSKIAAAISDRRSSLGAYNSMDLETAKAMKANSQTQKPQWEITATEMSMDLLNGRSGDISAGVSMGILKDIYSLTKNFNANVVARQEKFMQAANNIQSGEHRNFCATTRCTLVSPEKPVKVTSDRQKLRRQTARKIRHFNWRRLKVQSHRAFKRCQ